MTTRTFPLDGPINLHARLGRGAVTVEAVEGLTEASVELIPRQAGSDIADQVDVDLRGRTLWVVAPREGGLFDMVFASNRGKLALDALIRVPADTAMKISTVSADVTITGRASGADIAAGSANISIEHVTGDLRLRYGSGRCRIERVDGSVNSRSGSGSARFARIDGSFNATWGSGDLQIGLPAGRPARLDIQTGSGHVDSELAIVDRPASQGRPISVRARTGSGDVHLFRAS
ncbi:MAG TPA: DUF4097 family beta strand repeat-containing protein [Jatrophihabitantaceae bacterium]|jgi:hypothetical protein|nr:DUF4097 family beta strand repeat-containing protein [Jatrophihabitantaceae bacterium]